MHCIMLFMVSQALLTGLNRSFYSVCCFLFVSILLINLRTYSYLVQAAYRGQCETAYTCVMCCSATASAAGMEQAIQGDVRLGWT